MGSLWRSDPQRDDARAVSGTGVVFSGGQPRRELRLKPAALCDREELCDPEERPGLEVV
jgi:hypothetical protein